MAVRNAIGHVDNDQVADGSKDWERPREKFNSNLGGGRKGMAMMTKTLGRSRKKKRRGEGPKNASVVNS